MKNNKKLFSGIVALMMAASLLAGCGSQDQTQGTDAAGQSQTGTESESAGSSLSTAVDGHTKMNEEVTLSYLIYEHTVWPINDDNPVMQKMFEATNVKIESIVAPATNFDEKFNVAIMGNELPDLMMNTSIDTLNEYGQKGAFIPLEDLIEQYAPNISARLDDRAREIR